MFVENHCPILESRIERVTLFRRGARVTRVADWPKGSGEPLRTVRFAGLPVGLVDGSTRAAIIDGEDAEPPLQVVGLQIGLEVGEPREKKSAVELEEEIERLEEERTILREKRELAERWRQQLETLHPPARHAMSGNRAPLSSPTTARLELVRFRRQEMERLAKERLELEEPLRELEEKLAGLRAESARLSTADKPAPDDLRKSVRVTVQGRPPPDHTVQIHLSYEIRQARWTPVYAFDFSDHFQSLTLKMRALAAQSSGEDWTGVDLTFSTALPQRWTELPEATGIRIGKQQPPIPKTGWREPPPDAGELFEDHDRFVARIRPDPAMEKQRIHHADQRLFPNESLIFPPEDFIGKGPFDYLLYLGLVRRRTLDALFKRQNRENGSVASLLITEEGIDAKMVALSLAACHQVPFMPFDADIEPPKKWMKKLNKAYLRRQQWLPLAQEPGGAVLVGMADPGDENKRTEIERALIGVQRLVFRVMIAEDILRYLGEEPVRHRMHAAQLADVEEEATIMGAAAPAAVLASAEPMAEEATLIAGEGGTIPPDAAVSTGAATRKKTAPPSPLVKTVTVTDDFSPQMDYAALRMPAVSSSRRGYLRLLTIEDRYLEWFIDDGGDHADLVSEIVRRSRDDGVFKPPPGCHFADSVDGFDHAWRAEAPGDIPADGAFHLLPLVQRPATATVTLVTVPRESRDVFRRVDIENPLDGPLPPGPADIYQDGNYRMTSALDAVGRDGTIQLGMGVEQRVKVARNVQFREEEGYKLLAGKRTLHHGIEIRIANHLPASADLEILERIPTVGENERDIEVEPVAVKPMWDRYEPEEYHLEGGHGWRMTVAPGGETVLSVHYKITLPVKYELAGGNRRES